MTLIYTPIFVDIFVTEQLIQVDVIMPLYNIFTYISQNVILITGVSTASMSVNVEMEGHVTKQVDVNVAQDTPEARVQI